MPMDNRTDEASTMIEEVMYCKGRRGEGKEVKWRDDIEMSDNKI
jgi:hypothetical protein